MSQNKPPQPLPRKDVTIVSMPPGAQFCFGRLEDQQEVFIHRTAFAPPEGFDTVKVGDIVSAAIKDTNKGLRGVNVRPVRSAQGRNGHDTAQQTAPRGTGTDAPAARTARPGYDDSRRRHYPESGEPDGEDDGGGNR